MEFHLWAKLGTDGQVQSIQSSCDQSTTGSPVLPMMSRDEISCNNGSDKFVPYMEKKTLASKLGAKVDEMSMMMQQLADLGEKNKLQQKLIQQYEQEIATQRKHIRSLETDLFKWKSKAMFVSGTLPNSCSLDRTVTVPKQISPESFRGECSGVSLRRRSWPGGIDFRLNDEYDATEFRTRINSHDQSPLRDEEFMFALKSQRFDDGIIKQGIISKTSSRQSSLRVGVGISNTKSHFNLDIESIINDTQRDEIDGHGYSFAKNCPEEKLSVDNDKHVNEPNSTGDGQILNEDSQNGSENIVTGSENLEIGREHHTTLPEDEFGYLLMNSHLKNTLPSDEIHCSRNTEETSSLVPECSSDEIIHVTHRDLLKGNSFGPSVPAADNTKPNSSEKYLFHDQTDLASQDCVGSPHYETIQLFDINMVDVKPPLPPRRGSRSSINSTSSETPGTPNVQAILTCQTHHNTGNIEPPRPTTLPLNHDVVQRDTDVVSRSRARRVDHSKSTPTLPTSDLAAVKTRPESQQYNSAESRKDDTLNMLYKDMRTTMEWNVTKRRLMQESHKHTVDYVEKQLRAIVKEVYEMYGKLQKEKRSRASTKQKVLEKMEEKLKNGNYEYKFKTDDFLKKCIDMVVVTTPT
ncbi:hypothetical protein ACF0H5_010154 [Mactra antiquata]